MNFLTPEENMDRLRNFFLNNRGLVFCRPANTQQHIYPWLKNAVGLIHPIEADHRSTIVEVDWSISKTWHANIKSKMNSIKPVFGLSELEILDLQADIPQLVDELSDWDWNNLDKNDVVCIVGQRIMKEKNVEAVWHKYRKFFGVVQRVEDASVSVMFKMADNENVVRIVPKNWVVRLPPSFGKYTAAKTQSLLPLTSRPVGYNTHQSKTPAKFKVGEIVRTSSGASPDKYIGLIGVVVSIREVGQGYYPSYFYTISLNTLPNNSLSLCEGEDGVMEESKEFAESSLTNDFSPVVTEKPFLTSYRLINKRMKMWCIPKRKIVEVAMSKTPKSVSLEKGLVQEASGDDDTTPFDVSCRDLDYLYDKAALISALNKCHMLMMAVEEGRTDEDKKHPRVYMYAFNDKNLQRIKYRIYLGRLTSRPSLLKRFKKMFDLSQFTNPWQIRRYLMNKSLGYFYEIIDAKTSIEEIPEFEEWLA